MPDSHANTIGRGVIIRTPDTIGNDSDLMISKGDGFTEFASAIALGLASQSDLDDHTGDSLIHFADAPNDGQQYARQSLGWVVVTSAGEANTGENVGTGAEVYVGMNNTVLQFRRFQSSNSSIDISQNAQDLDLTATAATVGADPAGSAQGVQDNLTAHEGLTSIHFPDADSDGNHYARINGAWGIVNADGQANTQTNEGAGPGQFSMTKVGNNLPLKTLISGDDSVSITNLADTVDIRASGVGGGEVNEGRNLGDHNEVYVDKNGIFLEFRTLQSSDGSVTITQNAQDIDFRVGAADGLATAANETELSTVDFQLSDGDPIYLETHTSLRWGGGQHLIYHATGRPADLSRGWTFAGHDASDWYEATDKTEARLDRFGWKGLNNQSYAADNLDAFRRAWDASRTSSGSTEGAPIICTPAWAFMDPFAMADADDHHRDSEIRGDNCIIFAPDTVDGLGAPYIDWSQGIESHKEGILRNLKIDGRRRDRGAFPLVHIKTYALELDHCYFEGAGNDQAACLHLDRQQYLDLSFCTTEGDKGLDPKETIGYHIDSVRTVVMRHCRAEGVRVGCLINDASLPRTVWPSTRIEAFYAESTLTAVEVDGIGGVQVSGVYSTDDNIVNVHLKNGASGCVLHLEDSQGHCIIEQGCSGNTVYVRQGGTVSRVIDYDGRNKIIETRAGITQVSDRNGNPTGKRLFRHNFVDSFVGNFRSIVRGSNLHASMAYSNTIDDIGHGVQHLTQSNSNFDIGNASLEEGWNFVYIDCSTNTPGNQFGIEMRDPNNDIKYYNPNTRQWQDAQYTEWFNPSTEPKLYMYPVYNDLPSRTSRVRFIFRGPGTAGEVGSESVTFDPATDTFTAIGHSIRENQHVYLTGTPPDGFSTNQSYYAVDVHTDTFQLSLFPDEEPVEGTGTGSGLVANYTSGEIHVHYMQVSDARDAGYLYQVDGFNFGGENNWPPNFPARAALPNPAEFVVGTPATVSNDPTSANNGWYIHNGTTWVKNTSSGGGDGEANELRNDGTGEFIGKAKEGELLPIKSLTGSGAAVVTSTTDEINVHVDPGGGGGSQWDTVNDGINYSGGNVGFAEPEPQSLIHVSVTGSTFPARFQNTSSNGLTRLYAYNDIPAGFMFGVSGSAYTGVPGWTNRAIMQADSATNGFMWVMGATDNDLRIQSTGGTEIGALEAGGRWAVQRYAQRTENVINVTGNTGTVPLTNSNHFTVDLSGTSGATLINFTFPSQTMAGRIKLVQHPTDSRAITFGGGTIKAGTEVPTFENDPPGSERVISWTFDEATSELILMFTNVLASI